MPVTDAPPGAAGVAVDGLPWYVLSAPVSASKPASSWNTACMPPPRSSVPYRPNSDGCRMPELICVELALLWAPLLTEATPRSTEPYSLTSDADCAHAAADAMASAVHPNFLLIVILPSPGLYENFDGKPVWSWPCACLLQGDAFQIDSSWRPLVLGPRTATASITTPMQPAISTNAPSTPWRCNAYPFLRPLMHCLDTTEDLPNCLVSCDHIPRRSMPLFRAKAVLDELIAGFPPRSPSHRSTSSGRSTA